MATSTFDKNIEIGPEAAERLVKMLERPAPPRPSSQELWEREVENHRQVEEFLAKLRAEEKKK